MGLGLVSCHEFSASFRILLLRVDHTFFPYYAINFPCFPDTLITLFLEFLVIVRIFTDIPFCMWIAGTADLVS